MAEQFNPVDFGSLSATSDGKTLLYADDKVCKSISSLGELIDDKIGDKGFATENYVNNSISSLSGTVSSVYATKDEIDKMGNFIVTGANAQGQPDLEPVSAETKSIYLVKNESVTGKDQYNEWIVTENASEELVWTCIGDTSIELSGYALSADVSSALDLKEDKVFVAEYGVTTYAEIKEEYDAGKQIICKYYASQWIYAPLVQYITYSVQPFIFNSSKTTQDWEFTCIPNNGVNEWSQNTTHYYDKTETSGASQISDALDLKQNLWTTAAISTLTTSYDIANNTVTRIENNNVNDIIEFNITGLSANEVPNVSVEFINNQADCYPVFKNGNVELYCNTDTCDSGKNYMFRALGSMSEIIEMSQSRPNVAVNGNNVSVNGNLITP